MRSFQHAETFDPVPGRVVALLRRIDVGAGAAGRYVDQLPELLSGLAESARIESVTASSAIEGVLVDDTRRPGLLDGRTRRFRNRSEAEFAGYRAALDHLLQTDPGPLSTGLILHLHRVLLSLSGGAGGRFKLDDNVVVAYDPDGTRQVLFTAVSARETSSYVSELVDRANDALVSGMTHPLLVVSAFVLDLLCIHPFSDGNGRVARLLTTSLLSRAGYGAVRYVSLEQPVLERKAEYYESLAASTEGWFDDGRHTLWPWAAFLLECLAETYDRFEQRVTTSSGAGTKQQRVRDFVLLHGPATFQMADIRRSMPGVSDQTIHLVLRQLKAVGQVENDGTGRSASWTRAPG